MAEIRISGACLLLLFTMAPVLGQTIPQNPSVSEDANAPLLRDLQGVAPSMITRLGWNANAPLSGMKEHAPVGVIIHHTSVLMNKDLSIATKMRNLQSFSQRPGKVASHLKPAWADVPYHFYIDFAGSIAEGRDVHFKGDTNTNYDTTGHIQVVVEGDFEKETPTPDQLAALQQLLVWLSLSWNIPVSRISMHKDHAPTDCPGRKLITVLPRLLRSTGEQREQVIASLCGQSAGAAFGRVYCAN
jgi:hypothetical protein